MQDELTPYGYCECGCGQLTTVAKFTDRGLGRVAGKPMRFRPGHNKFSKTPWVEEDRGFDTPCWIWQLRIAHDGYGAIKRNNYAGFRAHKVYWIEANGPVPDGLELDHLCGVKACVNPAHLEPVTHAENMRRRSERMETCRRGHPRTPENVAVGVSGKRTCRLCRRITKAARKERLAMSGV